MAETMFNDDSTETIQGRHGTISFFSTDPVIGNALRRYGEWAENELQFFAKFVPEGGTVLDIGGFIGTHALAFARMVGPSGTVHSFEPQPLSFDLLSSNVMANSLSQVVLHRAAVGDEVGELAIEPMAVGSETNFGGLTVGGKEAGADQVAVKTIDTLGLQGCDFIKCDVEGMENLVLLGGASTIKAFRPVIYSEANSLDSAVKTAETLRRLGYSVYGHVVDAFNPNNLFSVTDNIFGYAREFGLIAVAQGQECRLESLSSPYWELYPIDTVDDLAYAMMQKHQYFDEVLRSGRAASVGGRVISGPDYNAIEKELAEIRRQAEDMHGQLLRERDELARSRARADVLDDKNRILAEDLLVVRRSDAELQQQLHASQTKAAQLETQLQRIFKSKIFRLFKRFIEKEMRFRERRRKRREKNKLRVEDIQSLDTMSKGAPIAPAARPGDHLSVKAIGRGLTSTVARSAVPVMLYVTHVSPSEPRAGNEYRIARVLKFIKGMGIEPILLLVPLPGQEPNTDLLEKLCAEFENVILVDRAGSLKCQLSLSDASEVLRGLDGRAISDYSDKLEERHSASRLLPIVRTFSPDLLIDVLTELERGLSPFCVMVNYGFMTRSFPLLSNKTFKVVDTHDVFSTKARKVTRFGIEDALTLTASEEATLLRSADLLVAIQPDEARELEELGSDVDIITVGVDMPVPPVASRPVLAPRLLMVASSNDMNCKGLRDFIRFAWPLIREAVPEAELDVVGSVGRELTGHEPGVRALGFVENLAAVYLESRVVINPAVAGTGLKIKTLEALGHLRPIVLWPSGLDGLHPDLARYCVCVNDWYQYSQAVITLLQDPASAHGLSAARGEITHLLSEDFTYAELKQVLEVQIAKKGSE
ncbi:MULTISPECIES: FkbM family methyltransferase [Agrobacterium]|uniref:FkbM family methyltransferase n=1 Tax=Agrobacterium TaxID=357 RepID=UPI000DCFCC66|nr:FkbM family methyltransferase [Agrobacterium sp. SORGH_AS_0745]MDP9562449.1 FkbM family methyltransferase [Rhizobium nepotum]MDP9757466.1 FkbM family methyltransferase [Agrobacterium tumefaciens]MDQ1218699.1 FkbM family methyltransferase [Agrobacterium sp. SORGH_AS_0745]